MRQRQSQRLRHHLRSRRRPQKLAPASGRSASPAPHLRRILQRNLPLRKPRPNRLHLAPRPRRSPAAASPRPAPARSATSPDEASAIIIAGNPLSHVATPITPLRVRQRPHQPPQHHRRIIAIRQRIQHPRRPLRPPIARIRAQPPQTEPPPISASSAPPPPPAAPLPSALCEIPAQSGCPSGCAQPAMRAQNQNLRPQQPRRIPSHAHILAQPKQIPRRLRQQHLRRNRQLSRRPRRMGPHRVKGSPSVSSTCFISMVTTRKPPFAVYWTASHRVSRIPNHPCRLCNSGGSRRKQRPRSWLQPIDIAPRNHQRNRHQPEIPPREFPVFASSTLPDTFRQIRPAHRNCSSMPSPRPQRFSASSPAPSRKTAHMARTCSSPGHNQNTQTPTGKQCPTLIIRTEQRHASHNQKRPNKLAPPAAAIGQVRHHAASAQPPRQ